MVLYWFGVIYFLGGDITGDFILIFFLESVFWSNTSCCSRQKRNISWNFDTKNISCGADDYNRLIRVDILVNFYVLVDSLFVLYISALGSTKSSFASSILLLGATESFGASLSSKFSLAWYFSNSAIGWNSGYSVIFAFPVGTTKNWYVSISWPSIFIL